MPHPTERVLSAMPIRQWPHHEHFGRTTHYPLVQASLAQRMGAKFSHSCVPVHARDLSCLQGGVGGPVGRERLRRVVLLHRLETLRAPHPLLWRVSQPVLRPAQGLDAVICLCRPYSRMCVVLFR